jgi:predicted metal-dependent enzyme (double-stranded beta helix superfamily)
MNGYSELIELLKNKIINDSIELKDFLKNWNVINDLSFDILKEKYKSIENKYFRENLYKDDNYEITLIFWCPHSHSPIHYHVNRGCIMKILDGTLRINKYEDSDFSTIRHTHTNIYNINDIEYIKGRHGIHKVFNDTDNMAISLHIYVKNSLK